MKNNRDEFKKLVIESIHGLPYEDYFIANNKCVPCNGTGSDKGQLNRKKECYWCTGKGYTWFYFPITIGRVMQALKNKGIFCTSIGYGEFIINTKIDWLFANWKLTKENGQECIDDDQTDETINSLIQLLK